MKITRVNKAGGRQVVSLEREERKKDGNAADRLSVSPAALRALEARQQTAARVRQAADAANTAGNALDALTPDRKTQSRCRKIAARIRAGDHVPPQDRRYLERYDSIGYQMAMAMRHVKARPKHWDSVVRDAESAHRPTAAGVKAVLASNRGRGMDQHRNPNRNPSREEEEA